MPGLFLLGLGMGVWDVAQNLEGTVIERALDKAIMPWFHAAFSGGTVLAALIGAGLVWLKVPLLVHLGVVAVLTVVAVWWGTGRFCPPNPRPTTSRTRLRRQPWPSARPGVSPEPC